MPDVSYPVEMISGVPVVAAPALASLAPRGRAWELARYRAYQANLADVPSITATGAHARR